MTRSATDHTRRTGARPDRGDDGGFTLVEMIIALLVLAIVLAASAPALFSTFKATASTDLRSIAGGLAVKANEQIRSLPYYEIGYYGSPSDLAIGYSGTPPTGCPSTGNPTVTLNSPGPMDSSSQFPQSQTVGNVTFTYQRCVYWIGASDNSDTSYTGAYIQSAVTVCWPSKVGYPTVTPCSSGAAHSLSVTQWSAVYPGGEGPYTSADNSNPPQQAVAPPPGSKPDPPGTPTASASSSSVSLSWAAPDTATKSTNYTYMVEYNTTGTFNTSSSVTQQGLYAYTTTNKTSATVSGLAPGSTYYFQIVAVNQGTPSNPSGILAQATTGTPDTSGTCTIYGMTVNPVQAQVNIYGYLQGVSFFTVGMSVSPGCTNGSGTVWAYFPTSSSSLNSVQLTGTGSMLAAEAGVNPDGSEMAWTPGNKTFTAYTGTGSSAPTAYSPSTYVQVNICQPNPVTGLC